MWRIEGLFYCICTVTSVTNPTKKKDIQGHISAFAVSPALSKRKFRYYVDPVQKPSWNSKFMSPQKLVSSLVQF